MSAWSAMGPGTRVLIVALGGIAAAGLGFIGWQVTRPAEVPAAAAVEVAESALQETTPAAGTLAEAEAVTAEDAAGQQGSAEPPTAPNLPKIDTWRVAPDGEALVAGIAAPEAAVEVLVDGHAVAAGRALASGEFVLQFTLAPNPEPSLMWLAMIPSGGESVASAEMVALGPVEGPKLAVADAAPEAVLEAEITSVEEDPPPPQAILLTDEGAVVLQDAVVPDPVPLTQVMIDTIAYSPAGEVQIGGRGTAGAALRIYLDNAEVAVLAVPVGGRWLVTLGDTAPGIYTLRVDQLNAGGKVASRFETPFKRETLEALAAASGQAAKREASLEKDVAAVEPVPVEEAPNAVTEALPDVLAAATPDATEAAPGSAAEPAPEAVAVATPDPAPVSDNAVEATAAPDPAAAQAELAVAEMTSPEMAQVEESLATASEDPTAGEPAPVIAAATPTPPRPVTVTVQPGFTLWGIAQERYGDGVMYVQVFDANRDKIKNPDLIYPGQVFAVPELP